jgi:hypothetical protein
MICKGFLGGEIGNKGLSNKEINLTMKNLNELILQVE